MHLEVYERMHNLGIHFSFNKRNALLYVPPIPRILTTSKDKLKSKMLKKKNHVCLILLLTFNLSPPSCFERLKIGQSLSYIVWIFACRHSSYVDSWSTDSIKHLGIEKVISFES